MADDNKPDEISPEEQALADEWGAGHATALTDHHNQ